MEKKNKPINAIIILKKDEKVILLMSPIEKNH